MGAALLDAVCPFVARVHSEPEALKITNFQENITLCFEFRRFFCCFPDISGDEKLLRAYDFET